MTRPLRVLITDRAWPDCSIERDVLAPLGVELIESPRGDEDTLAELARGSAAIGTCWADVTERVIRAAGANCRIVARFGIGLDNISISTATELGIPVTNVPDYCVAEVSDHALALLLACARNIAFFHARTKAGEYRLAAGPPMRRLSGATLGLVGFGHTARALARKARAIGLRVVASSRSLDDRGDGVSMLPLDDLLPQCDFVSLHVPLNESTHRMIGEAQLARMKRSAYLINTARGGLIDHDALWRAIASGRLAGAALDVFEPERPDLSLPLFRDERVVLTPHAAFLSEESVNELRSRASAQIAAALQGLRPPNVVNPQIYNRTT